MKGSAVKTAYLGLFTAGAVIIGYIESLFPLFMGIPGIKPGLANLAVLLLLYRVSLKEAASVSIVRILIIGAMFGNLFSIAYSLAGAFCSLTVMTLLLKKTRFSLLGISAAGGVVHNIAQLLVAILIVKTPSVQKGIPVLLYYAPALITAGVVTGLLVGLITREVDRRLPPFPWIRKDIG